ncbi:MAG: response regulator, partial [Acidobacteria bacterium]
MAQDLGKVLIVDDEQDILDLLSFNLVKEGFQVITSKNGEDALRAALRERPDLVVLDIMLPGFSGIEVLKRLKHLELTRKTPVMMLTAKNE